MLIKRPNGAVNPRGPSPAELVAALKRSGPLAVRAGQLLGLCADELPRSYCEALLQLEVPMVPMPWPEVQAIIDEDIDPGPEARSARVDPIPIVSGPMTQTHRAQLGDGTPVLVKVRRSGLVERLDGSADLRSWAGFLLDGRVPLAVPIEGKVRELIGSLGEELDLLGELDRLERMHELTPNDPNQETPRPHRSLSGPRVLTVDDLPGWPALSLIHRPPDPDEPAPDRPRFAASLLRAILAQVGDQGFFQPDFHPANLMTTPTGQVRFAGYGHCVELAARERDAAVRYLAAVYNDDLEELRRSALGLFTRVDGTGLADFHRSFEIEAITWSGDPWGRETSDDEPSRAGRSLSVTRLEGVLTLARRHCLEISPPLVAVHRAVIAAETFANHVTRDLDLPAIGREFFDDLQSRERLRSLQPENVQQTLTGLGILLRDLPSDLVDILSQLSDNRLDFGLNVSQAKRDELAQARRVRIVVTALACLAVSIAVASSRTTTFLGISTVGPLVGVLVGLLIWLVAQWRHLQ